MPERTGLFDILGEFVIWEVPEAYAAIIALQGHLQSFEWSQSWVDGLLTRLEAAAVEAVDVTKTPTDDAFIEKLRTLLPDLKNLASGIFGLIEKIRNL